MQNRAFLIFEKCINHKSQGSISVLLLIVCTFILLSAQLALYMTSNEYKRTLEDLRRRQLRLLCYSAIEAVDTSVLTEGTGCLADAVLEPGGDAAKLTYVSEHSSDNCFYGLELKAEDKSGLVSRLSRYDFFLPEKLAQLGRQYPLIYKNRIVGTEYLSGSDVYTSNEEVLVPQVEFLRNVGLSPVNDESITKKGFNSRFYYVKDKSSGRNFTFSSGSIFYGSTVFGCQGNIKIGADSKFPGRMVFIARKGNVELGSNVQMDNVVIIADNTVSVGAGCRIKGVIYADTIRIKGKAVFLKDENLVAQISSKRFIS